MSTDIHTASATAAIFEMEVPFDLRTTARTTGHFGGLAWSAVLRLRFIANAADVTAGTLLSIAPVDGPASHLLELVRESGSLALRFSLLTDFRPTPLTLNTCLSATSKEWTTVIVRCTPARIELLVDGVLMDEEWPTGNVPTDEELVCMLGGAASPSGVEMAQVALWNRTLSEDEVITIAGGSEWVAQRTTELLGAAQPFGAYWTPRGTNTGVGDCMPFFHDGRFHLFYLFDRRAHRSKWNLGAHQWAHASTTDLRTWVEHPMAIAITDPKEGSICTGSVIFHDGLFRAFYATRMNDGSAAPLQVATSTDCTHFEKQPPFGRLTAPYQPGPARDPVVFHDPADGLFHMLVTSSLEASSNAHHGGCLAHLTSSDLTRWTQIGPFLVPGYADQPECPDHFTWNDWYYVVFSNHGIAHYRMSRSAQGPWTRPVVDAFDGPRMAVLKTASFTDGRRIGAAFLRLEQGYAGELIFRELVQHADGTLGTCLVNETLPQLAPPIALSWGNSDPHDNLRVAAWNGFATLRTLGIPRDFHLRCRVTPAAGSAAFGICIRSADRYADGLELRFEPMRRKVGWRRPTTTSFVELEADALYEVDGLNASFTIELVVHGECVDLCIDGRRTLVVRMTNVVPTTPGLSLFANEGEVCFADLVIRPVVTAG